MVVVEVVQMHDVACEPDQVLEQEYRAGRVSLGQWGEALVAQYLTRRGWQILDRNWRCRAGELDLVADDGVATVFIEVKTRTGLGFGHPLEAITRAKLAKLYEVAQYWLVAHPVSTRRPVRFDAVGVLRDQHRVPALAHVCGVSPS